MVPVTCGFTVAIAMQPGMLIVCAPLGTQAEDAVHVPSTFPPHGGTAPHVALPLAPEPLDPPPHATRRHAVSTAQILPIMIQR